MDDAQQDRSDAGPGVGGHGAADDVDARRRAALQRLAKVATYTTPVIVGMLTSEAWAQYG